MKFDKAIQKFAAKKFGPQFQKERLQKAAQEGAELAKVAYADPTFREVVNQIKEANWMKEVGKSALGLAGAAAIVGTANLGMRAVEDAYRSMSEGREKAKAFSEMLSVHKQLGQEDKRKVQQGFNTLWNFNPHAAQDPLLAGSFVQRSVDYGAVTTDEVAKLVSMRKALRDAEARESFVGSAGLQSLGGVGV